MVLDLGKIRILLQLSVIALAWGWGPAPGLAAERLKVLIGPFEQSMAITDIERFVQTGELAPSLRFYALVLTPDLRQILGSRLQLDPDITRLAIDGLGRSPSGKRLSRALGAVILDSTPQQLQLTLASAAQQGDGLNLIGILKAYPEKTIKIDATSALAVAFQLNLKYLESQVFNSLLKRDLAVASDPLTSTLDPAMPGPKAVQTQTRLFADIKRQRIIPVDLYWSANTQGPLVVISHGFNSNRKHLAYLARHLASHSLAVAALEHPGSSSTWLRAQATTIGPPLPGNSSSPAETLVERPKDVSFLLNELATLNQQSGPLQGKLNTRQVSVIGHSLGGYTALALAGGRLDLDGLRDICQKQNPLGLAPANWFQCYATKLPGHQMKFRDKRVVQVMVISPLVSNLFGSQGLSQVATPTLMMSGTNDAITPAVSNQLRPFAQLPHPKYLLTAIGANHYSIVNDTTSASASTSVLEPGRRQTEPLQALLQGISLAFIRQLTPQARAYEPFLTPAYAQSFSTAELPLRLNTELPTSVARLLE